ncbi:MAG: F0F1 ATP synthase subunit delta, partial [Hyphomicrobium sp.]
MASNETVVEGVAGRYASALFDLAKEASKVSEVEADLNKFQAMLDESDDLRSMVRSPVIATEDQSRAMGALLAKAGIGGLAANFFKLIAGNRRLFATSDIIKAYRAISAKERG